MGRWRNRARKWLTSRPFSCSVTTAPLGMRVIVPEFPMAGFNRFWGRLASLYIPEQLFYQVQIHLCSLRSENVVKIFDLYQINTLVLTLSPIGAYWSLGGLFCILCFLSFSDFLAVSLLISNPVRNKRGNKRRLNSDQLCSVISLWFTLI